MAFTTSLKPGDMSRHQICRNQYLRSFSPSPTTEKVVFLLRWLPQRKRGRVDLTCQKISRATCAQIGDEVLATISRVEAGFSL